MKPSGEQAIVWKFGDKRQMSGNSLKEKQKNDVRRTYRMKNYGKRIAEYMPWLLLTGCVEGICILFLALADVQVLQVLAGVLT